MVRGSAGDTTNITRSIWSLSFSVASDRFGIHSNKYREMIEVNDDEVFINRQTIDALRCRDVTVRDSRCNRLR